MRKITVDMYNGTNEVTENGKVINKGNRPQDVVFARNVVRELVKDRSFDLTNIGGVCIASEMMNTSEYVKFSPKEHWYV